jgi:Winged helix-turn helix
MEFPAVAVERAMTYQQVIMRAVAGTWTWLKAADVLGIHPRSLRRWRARYERDPVLGLLDRRRRRPSHRTAPRVEVQRVLQLYRVRYQGFNVRHFLHIARRDHGVTLSYTFVKLVLQAAGLVPKARARGRHRRRREPRPCVGELLHLDGSDHEWLAGGSGQRQTLLAVLDDATKRLLYAQLWPAETTHAVLMALRAVLTDYGMPIALYTDRAGWAFHTPAAGGPVDRTHLTVVGRILARLGIDHIPSYSPQARGRVERLNRTLQGRLVNELRVAGITTLEAANAYLREQFIPDYNREFTRPPADPASAFVPLGAALDLDQLLAEDGERLVGRDNVVSFEGLALQLAKQRGRRSCTGLRVLVRRHLTGEHTVWRGPQCLGRFDAQGRPLDGPRPRAPKRPPPPLRGPSASRPKNARAHLAQDATVRGRPYRDIPPREAPPRRRRGPRLPVGPGD